MRWALRCHAKSKRSGLQCRAIAAAITTSRVCGRAECSIARRSNTSSADRGGARYNTLRSASAFVLMMRENANAIDHPAAGLTTAKGSAGKFSSILANGIEDDDEVMSETSRQSKPVASPHTRT